MESTTFYLREILNKDCEILILLLMFVLNLITLFMENSKKDGLRPLLYSFVEI